MKAIFILLCVHLIAPAVLAQSFSLDWRKIAGGGGNSTGVTYSVSGTTGQHDASQALTSSKYSVTGGFWGFWTLQTPGAPKLGIALTSTNTVLIFWPAPSTGFSLQVSPDGTLTNWISPAELVTDNGTTKFIIVNPPAGNRFYRLKYP